MELQQINSLCTPHPSPISTHKHLFGWMTEEDEEVSQQVLSVDQYLVVIENMKDEEINDFIYSCLIIFSTYLNQILSIHAQENLSMVDAPPIPQETPTTESLKSLTEPIDISLGKFLNINQGLSEPQKKQLIEVLRKYNNAFTWDYTNMKGIHPELCTHHIYIKEQSRPIHQPQRRMNPTLKEIVKEELHKILSLNFIYPIYDNQWVSPLIIVPKNNGKWRICIDYRELNKSTHKDHFPLPFIDQVLDTLAGRNTSLSLMGLVATTKFKLHPRIKRIPHSLSHGEHFHIGCFHLDFAMLQLPFRGNFLVYFLISFTNA
jgi:hypothetical protein